MAAEYSSGSSSYSHGRSMDVLCKCKLRASMLTSKTEANPGRRFFSCHFSSPSICDKRCNFFMWYDGEIVGRPREMMNRLIAEKKKLKEELLEMSKKLEEMEVDLKELAKLNNQLKIENLSMKKEMQEISSRNHKCFFGSIVIVVIMLLMFVTGDARD